MLVFKLFAWLAPKASKIIKRKAETIDMINPSDIDLSA